MFFVFPVKLIRECRPKVSTYITVVKFCASGGESGSQFFQIVQAEISIAKCMVLTKLNSTNKKTII